MVNKQTGGPAFPGVDEQGEPYTGMTLRDFFAAKAMPAVITDWLNTGNIFSDAYIAEVIARDCYIVADAMLEARKK